MCYTSYTFLSRYSLSFSYLLYEYILPLFLSKLRPSFMHYSRYTPPSAPYRGVVYTLPITPMRPITLYATNTLHSAIPPHLFGAELMQPLPGQAIYNYEPIFGIRVLRK